METPITVLCAVALVYAGYQVITYLMENDGYSWKKFYQDICHVARKLFGPLKIEEPAEEPAPATRRH